MRGYTNYNAVAWFYDGLSKLVFGSSIKKAQIDLLPLIPANSKLLIVGGGTGWILEEITKLHTSGIEITYVDSSSKMIERSKKRNYGSNKVQFIEISLEHYLLPDTGNLYNVIITPFIADCFSQADWEQVFTKLDAGLQTNGIWLYADFRLNNKSPMWQRLLIKLLYLFFRITCRLKVKELPLVDTCFSLYKPVSERIYFAGFIVSQAFSKS